MNNSKAIGSFVQAEMRRQMLTQRSLATAMGVSEKHISRVLNGKDGASLELWDRILSFVGFEFRLVATEERPTPIIHGRLKTFRESGCRCGLCYKADRDARMAAARRAERAAGATASARGRQD